MIVQSIEYENESWSRCFRNISKHCSLKLCSPTSFCPCVGVLEVQNGDCLLQNLQPEASIHQNREHNLSNIRTAVKRVVRCCTMLTSLLLCRDHLENLIPKVCLQSCEPPLFAYAET